MADTTSVAGLGGSIAAAAAASAEEVRWRALEALISEAKEASEGLCWEWECMENAAAEAKSAANELTLANRIVTVTLEGVANKIDTIARTKAAARRADEQLTRKTAAVAKERRAYLACVKDFTHAAAESTAAATRALIASDACTGKFSTDTDEATAEDGDGERPDKRARADEA